MGFSHQGQKAGDNAQQIQAGTIIINNGISEERVRAIFSEMQERAIQEYTQDAYEKANERIQELEKALAPLVERNEENLSFFADPAFQIALKKAQISAAKTDSKDDYDLLAELLDKHVKNKEDRKKKAAIDKAIESISEIDNFSLCALTVSYAVKKLLPCSGNISNGLQTLDNIFEKLLYLELPTTEEWMDHLDVMGMLRVSSFVSLKKLAEYYSERLDGYVCSGILSNSDTHENVLNMLTKVNIARTDIVPHELVENYVRLSIYSKEYINKINMSEEQKNIIFEIIDLYSKDKKILQQAKDNFSVKINSYSNLNKVRTWWDNISSSFTITQVGQVLAITNLKRVAPELSHLFKD